jgi:hypothetical protein
MKILFFSEDDVVVDLIEGVGHQNMVVTDDDQVVLGHSESARCLIFLDFDENKKAAEKLNKSLMDGDDVRIVMTEKIKLKELKKHQKGATAADGYVRKPISLKIINEILNDFELSDYIQASEAFDEGDTLGEVSLSSIEGAESEFDENSEIVDFDAGIMKVDDRVKEQLDAHSLDREGGPNFATPLNVDIQSKFDMVFDRPFLANDSKPVEESSTNIPSPEEQQNDALASPVIEDDGGFDLDMGTEDSDDGLDMDLGEEESLDVDLSMDEEDENINLSEEAESEEIVLGDSASLEAAPPQEEAMEDDNDLDFDVEEDELDFDDGALEFGGAGQTIEEEEIQDDEVEGLDFATADESKRALDMGEDAIGGVDLENNDEGGIDLGEGDDISALEMGDDDAGSLDLGSDDDDGSLDLGSDDDAGSLDLGSDDDDGSLDLGSDDDAGALDLGESENSLDLGEPETLDAENEFDEISTTIEGIVAIAEDEEDGELNILSSEDAADAELDAGDESLNFGESEDEVEIDEEVEEFEEETNSEVLDFSDDEEIGESTNPTVLMEAEDKSLKEFKATLPSDSSDDEDELDLYAVDEDEGDFGEDEFNDDLTATELLETSTEELAPQEAALPAKVVKETPVVAMDQPIIITPEEQRVAEAFNQTEQTRLQGTIRQLREEREELIKEIHELKSESKLGDQDKLGLRAELDEAKIEIQILKKRNHDEIDELKYRVRLSEEKKQIYEERAKTVQKEFDRLNQKVRIDINQVKHREKELESQLELISMDSQSQVKSRDMKILDLKRKIDSLEFNMENASIREVKSREDKEKVEERLEKIMRTLRGSLKSLESDNDMDDGILDKIDKL